MSDPAGAARREEAPSGSLLALRVVAVLAIGLVVLSAGRVIRRLAFDYDLVLWADDYLMTSLMKLAVGQPVYGPIADGNSTVYAPGAAWLHHALLAPFGLGTSLLANKILVQLWLAVGVFATTGAVLALSARTGDVLPGGRGRETFGVAAAFILALCAYTNPTADSLHPATLESVILGAALWALAEWDRTSLRGRMLLAIALPAAGLVVKQNAGAAVALSLALAPVIGGAGRRRWLEVSVPLLSLAAAFGGLVAVTRGGFRVWAVEVLAAHPFDFHKVTDLYDGYGLLFVPVLVVVVATAVRARRRRGLGDAAWMRAATLLVLVALFALAALFKRLGGPNNLAVVGFLLTALALPAVGGALLGRRGAVRSAAFCVIALQLGLWHPRRRVPEASDFANAEMVCEYAAARMRCGEAVLLGRGTVCYARAGVAVPLDRATSLIDVSAASRGEELGFFQRLRSQHYDLIIMPAEDLQWFGKPLWEEFEGRYKAFHMTHGETEGDFWFHGWQGFASRPVVFFERVRDTGAHSVDERGHSCARR